MTEQQIALLRLCQLPDTDGYRRAFTVRYPGDPERQERWLQELPIRYVVARRLEREP